MFRDLVRCWGRRMKVYLSGRAPGSEDAVVSRPKKKKRLYFYCPACQKRRRVCLVIATVSLIAIAGICAAKLSSYALDYYRSRQSSDALREIYLETETETASPTVVLTPTPAPTPFVSAAPVADALQTLAPTATPPTTLEAVRYPHNAYAIISSRFQKLRRQNSDIIGWLTIENVLDEAVVQRDNTYYLDRDYRGYHNVNGAIFLDESCDLRTRPYTLMLYGHNMKTGAMFGCLRNYENLTYYRNNPFITFNSAYEDGRYVIFSVAVISTDPGNWQFVNFAKLNSMSIKNRQEALESLIRRSVYASGLDVIPQDQLLLLVTCVEDDDLRRVIAARRLREDETESELQKTINRTRKR